MKALTFVQGGICGWNQRGGRLHHEEEFCSWNDAFGCIPCGKGDCCDQDMSPHVLMLNITLLLCSDKFAMRQASIEHPLPGQIISQITMACLAQTKMRCRLTKRCHPWFNRGLISLYTLQATPFSSATMIVDTLNPIVREIDLQSCALIIILTEIIRLDMEFGSSSRSGTTSLWALPLSPWDRITGCLFFACFFGK